MVALKICKYIPYSKVEKIKNNKQFADLRKNNDLIFYIGFAFIDDIRYEAYCDYVNNKYYIINPE